MTEECQVSGIVGDRYYNRIPKDKVGEMIDGPEMRAAVDAIGYTPGSSDGTGAPYIREVMDKMRGAGWPVPSWKWYTWRTRIPVLPMALIPVLGWLMIYWEWNERWSLTMKHPSINGVKATLEPNSYGYVTRWTVSVRK